jgi:hypothetical protein
MRKGLLIILCSALYFISAAQVADRVLLNGQIITLQSVGDRQEAIAIKDGKVLGLGTTASIKKWIGTTTVITDLKGQIVVPGFNDVHQHPAPVYDWTKPYATIRLDTVSSMKSLIALVKRKANVTPKGMLIRGVGYNELKLGGQPIRDSLDLATKEHPVLLSHASGHLSAANSMMLELNGINKNTQDPPGGSFERDKNGIPDGIIKETARQLFRSQKVITASEPTHEQELEGYRIYFRNMLSGGLTSIGDCWTTPEKVKIYQELVAEHFPIRFNLYIGVDYLDQLINGTIQRTESDFLRIEGVKMIHGNSLSGKTCWLYDPYDMINPATNKKDYYGIPPARNQASLDSLVLKIHHANLQIACHSNGDREIDMLINAIERAQKKEPKPDIRHRIEHCSITNQEILNRIKADHIIPVFHNYINELGGQLKVYGAKRLDMLMPTKTAWDMGIAFAFHSDYPISRYEAMIRLGSAVNRTAPDGEILGAQQRMNAEDAIYAFTVGGAYTSHEENKKGKLIAGQFADLVILDKDPSKVAPVSIGSIQVMGTMVAGNLVYEKK